MKKLCLPAIILIALLCAACAPASALTSLSMDSTEVAPPPKDEGFLSDYEYKDSTIHVTIEDGVYNEVKYYTAHVQISDPSQFRAVPAQQYYVPDAVFSPTNHTETYAANIAQAANAVIAINTDFFTITDHCMIAMRQGKQLRNMGNGTRDVLVVDRKGDFSILYQCKRDDYNAYYNEHSAEMYQVFCFGPVLIDHGRSLIDNKYKDGSIISTLKTQRMAIAQIGPLDYLIIVCDGDSRNYTFGMVLFDFTNLCLELQDRYAPEGFRYVYNLDGGNSATLIFKQRDEENNLVYRKLNIPERQRKLSDMICFVTLEDE